jgi:ABC-type multidrug transport system ATPase subunit
MQSDSRGRDHFALQGVVKRWGSAVILEGAELVVEAGAAVHIEGVNGAGKTTFLRVCAGLLTPDAGTVSFAGLDPHRDRRAFLYRTGFLSAGDHGLYGRLSAREHLRLGTGLAMLPRARRAALVDRAIEAFGLGEFADRRVERASTGQRQRVRLALAFVHDPDLLLLDEPENSLDEDGEAMFSRALHASVDAGACALVCSPGTSAGSFDWARRYTLKRGRLVPA